MSPFRGLSLMKSAKADVSCVIWPFAWRRARPTGGAGPVGGPPLAGILSALAFFFSRGA